MAPSIFRHLNQPRTTSHSIIILASNQVVLPNEVHPATIVICQASGRIAAIYRTIVPQSYFPKDATYINYHDLILMPGLVDTHVHLNEPGRTSSEGFYTGTQAAASGGITTVVDMPLNSIPATTSLEALDTKIRAAQGKCWVDVGFLGGIVPGNTAEMKPMISAGVRGFKGFLIDSGVPEFPQVLPSDITKAMEEISSEPSMLMFHAEMLPASNSEETLSEKESDSPYLYPISARDQSYIYSEFLHSRPPSFETRAVRELISLAQTHPSVPIHVAHVSTAEVIPIIKAAQDQGVNISAETCFHYLSLSAEDVAIRDTRYKAEPPIRDAANKAKLWSSLLKPADQEKSMVYPHADSQISLPSPLRQQPISMVVSDHSPCAPTDKLLPSYIPPHAEPPAYHDDVIKAANGDFFHAWGGISSLGLGLSVMWTELHKQTQLGSNPEALHSQTNNVGYTDGSTLLQLSHWLSANPARLVGLEHQKGSLRVGFDGDVLVMDPDRYWTVEAADMKFKHKMSAYQGRTLRGRVLETWVRGRKVFDLQGYNGGFGDKQPQGTLLLEPRVKHQDRPGQNCVCRRRSTSSPCCDSNPHDSDLAFGEDQHSPALSTLLDQVIGFCCGVKSISI